MATSGMGEACGALPLEIVWGIGHRDTVLGYIV